MRLFSRAAVATVVALPLTLAGTGLATAQEEDTTHNTNATEATNNSDNDSEASNVNEISFIDLGLGRLLNSLNIGQGSEKAAEEGSGQGSAGKGSA